MHVLVHALAARRFGGAARHLHGFLRALEDWASDVQFTVFVEREFLVQKGSVGYDRSPKVTVVPVASESAARRVYWDQVTLPRLARQRRADAIWSILGFGPGWNSSPVSILNFQRTPTYYCRYHLGTLRPRERAVTLLRRQMQYLGMRAAHRVITPTDGMRTMVRGVYPRLPAAKFATIPHAFEPDTLRAPVALPAHVDALMPAGEWDGVRLVYVGHLLPYKGLDTLLSALALAQKRSPQPLRAYLTVAPEDWAEGYRTFLHRRDELGLTEVVTMLGKVPEHSVAEIYRRADVLAFPSLCESFGWPVMEAMSFGLPVIAAATPVNQEQVGDAGLYYAPGDAAAAADHLVRLVDDADLRAALGERGRVRVEQVRVTWRDYVRRCLLATADP